MKAETSPTRVFSPRWPVVVRLGFVALYPFLVRLGLETGWPRLTAALLALALLALALPHGASTARRSPLKSLPFGVAAVLLTGLALALGQADLLLYLPVVSNLAFLWIFASSLLHGAPLVETFARLWEAELSAEKVRYCRVVTAAWSGFFMLSGAVAWALAQRGNLAAWALYTGVLAHVCAALFGFAELLVRVKRFGPDSAGPLRKLFERSRTQVTAARDLRPLRPMDLAAKDPHDAA